MSQVVPFTESAVDLGTIRNEDGLGDVVRPPCHDIHFNQVAKVKDMWHA